MCKQAPVLLFFGTRTVFTRAIPKIFFRVNRPSCNQISEPNLYGTVLSIYCKFCYANQSGYTDNNFHNKSGFYLEYSLVIILIFNILIHEWGMKYGNVICKLSKIDFFYQIIYNNYLKCTIYELNMALFYRQKLMIMHCCCLK